MTAHSSTVKAAAPRSLLDLPLAELEREFAAAGLSPTHARTLWRALYADLKDDWADAPDFLPPLQRWLATQVGEERRFFVDAP
ncbi:MAG TPA: hypothetical protein VG347_10110, partial [Verrucomicrobiae bacterium]|nr:hypothetical protein [Verrucomicrobiae bacterium]